jgi:uncharacterized Zn finger protein
MGEEFGIQTTTPKGYEEAILYLKNIRRLLAGQGRTVEWLPYFEEMRSTPSLKKKFIGMLDVLEEKKIFQVGSPERTC